MQYSQWNRLLTLVVAQGVGQDLSADKVNSLICIDASSKAIKVAKRNTADKNNCHVVARKD